MKKNFYIGITIIVLFTLTACGELFPGLTNSFLVVEVRLPELAGLYVDVSVTAQGGEVLGSSEPSLLDTNGYAVKPLRKNGETVSFKDGTSLLVYCHVREGASREAPEHYSAMKLVVIKEDSKVLFTPADNIMPADPGTQPGERPAYQVQIVVTTRPEFDSYYCSVQLHAEGIVIDDAAVTLNSLAVPFERNQQNPAESDYYLNIEGTSLPGGAEVVIRIVRGDYAVTKTFTMPQAVTNVTPSWTTENALEDIVLGWNNGIPLSPLPHHLVVKIYTPEFLRGEDLFFNVIAPNSVAYCLPPGTLVSGKKKKKIDIESQNFFSLNGTAFEADSHIFLINNGYTYFSTEPITSLKADIRIANVNDRGYDYCYIEANLKMGAYLIDDAVVSVESPYTFPTPVIIDYLADWEAYRYSEDGRTFVPGETVTLRIRKDDLDITETCTMPSPLTDFTPWDETVDAGGVIPIAWTHPNESLDFIYLSIFPESLVQDSPFRDETISPTATGYEIPAGLLLPGTNDISLWLDAGKRIDLEDGANSALMEPGSVLKVYNVITAPLHKL